MTRLRRSFTAEFKLEAASLVLDQGYFVPEASRSLDVGETVLRRWVQQLQSERGAGSPHQSARARKGHSKKGYGSLDDGRVHTYALIDRLREQALITLVWCAFDVPTSCWDNAPMERLFRSLESEWLPAMGYMSVREATRDISYYLMDYYNWRRPHHHNDGIPSAKAEVRPNQVSGFS